MHTSPYKTGFEILPHLTSPQKTPLHFLPLCLSLRGNRKPGQSCRSRAGCFLVDPIQKQIFPMQKARKSRRGSLLLAIEKAVQSLLSEAERGSQSQERNIAATLQSEGLHCSILHSLQLREHQGLSIAHTHSTLHCRVWAVEAALAVSSHSSCSKACARYFSVLKKTYCILSTLLGPFLKQAALGQNPPGAGKKKDLCQHSPKLLSPQNTAGFSTRDRQ